MHNFSVLTFITSLLNKLYNTKHLFYSLTLALFVTFLYLHLSIIHNNNESGNNERSPYLRPTQNEINIRLEQLFLEIKNNKGKMPKSKQDMIDKCIMSQNPG